MKISLYWFSGTGNTAAVVQAMVEEFRKAGVDVTLRSLEKGYVTQEPVDQQAIIGFAFPANTKAVSPFVWRFLKSLPEADAKGKRAFMVATYNDSIDVAGPLRSLLAGKGYEPIASCAISMPGNMALKSFDATQEGRFEKGIIKAKEYAKAIVAGTATWEAESDKGRPRLLSALSRLTPLPWVSQRMLFKLKTDADLCSSCGLCVRSCPVANITAQGYIHGSNCQFCFSCMASCPRKAVKVKGRNDVVVRRARVGGE